MVLWLLPVELVVCSVPEEVVDWLLLEEDPWVVDVVDDPWLLPEEVVLVWLLADEDP